MGLRIKNCLQREHGLVDLSQVLGLKGAKRSHGVGRGGVSGAFLCKRQSPAGVNPSHITFSHLSCLPT